MVALMVESVDTRDLKSLGRKTVRVRVPLGAQKEHPVWLKGAGRDVVFLEGGGRELEGECVGQEVETLGS